MTSRREGRLLVTTRHLPRGDASRLQPGESKERDLSWLDCSLPTAISADGRSRAVHGSWRGRGTGLLRLRSHDRRLSGGSARRGSRLRPCRRTEWAIAIAAPRHGPAVGGSTRPEPAKRRFPEGRALRVERLLVPGRQEAPLTANEPGRGPRSMHGLRRAESRAPLTPEGYRGLRVVSRRTASGWWSAGRIARPISTPLREASRRSSPGVEAGRRPCGLRLGRPVRSTSTSAGSASEPTSIDST